MRKKIQRFYKKLAIHLTLTRPLRRKLRMRLFLDVSKVKESSFLKLDLTDPPLRFLMRIFWEIPHYALIGYKLQLSFFSGFYIKIMFRVRQFYSLFERMKLKRKRTMFIQTNQLLITSFYIKRSLFCRISDQSALIRTFLRNGHVRG